MFHAIAAGLTTLAMLTAPAAVITDPPDSPDHITIDVVTVNGSGCPKDTAAVAVADDKKAFTVTYSAYSATVGGGVATSDRKNCQMSLNVHVPQGFTYAIAEADYRGYADLNAISATKKATGQEVAGYYFQGMPSTYRMVHQIKSPSADGGDDWQFSDQVGVAALVYKPCGVERNLNINTELRVQTPNKSDPESSVTMDSTDASVSTVYHFSWLQC